MGKEKIARGRANRKRSTSRRKGLSMSDMKEYTGKGMKGRRKKKNRAEGRSR